EEIASDGSGAPRVLLKGAKMIPNDWSPDGHLVFMDWAEGPPHMGVYSIGDHRVTEFSACGAEAQFSPSGKVDCLHGLGPRRPGDLRPAFLGSWWAHPDLQRQRCPAPLEPRWQTDLLYSS